MSRIAFVTTSTALLALAMAIAPLSARAAGTTPTFVALPLERALDLAGVRSASVLRAIATVRRSEAELQIARLSLLPSATAAYALAPQAGVNSPAAIAQHSWTVGAGISISDLVSGNATIRSAAAALLAAQRDADSAVLRERERTVKLYFGALQACATLRLREQLLEGATADQDAAAVRTRKGDAPQLDLVRAGVALAQAHAELARATADRDDAVAALASETGVDSASLADISEGAPLEGHSRARSLTPEDAANRAVAGRPEIASLRAQLQARQADLEAAHASAFPKLVAGAGYQWGIDSGQPANGTEAAINVEFPLGFTFAQRTQIAQAEISATSADLDETTRAIALSAAAATRDADAAALALEASLAARDQAHDALHAIQIGYREGASSSLDVSEARRTYVQASLDALAAQYDRAQADAIFEIEVP
jgi:outer membrane protein TolC